MREISEKLKDCLTAPKKCQEMLKNFLNNIIFTLIPPLLFNGEFVLKLQKKLLNKKLLNKFFAFLCFLVKNPSTLPPSLLQIDKVIDKVSFTKNDITQIIRKSNLKKSHGWENICIRIIKNCDIYVSFPLKHNFETSFQERILPDPYPLKNYRSSSLLPVFQKTLRIKFNDLFHNFITNELFYKLSAWFFTQ